MTLPAFIKPESSAVVLSLKVQPRASKNEIGEPLGAELRVRVTAPPVDAAANEAVVRLLSETLHCSRSSVELLRGHTSRHKTVRVHGLKAEAILALLTQH